jgi:hypothetical protein
MEYRTEQCVVYEPYTEKNLIPKPVHRSRTETSTYVPDYQHCWNKVIEKFKRQIGRQLKEFMLEIFHIIIKTYAYELLIH